jgi:hypothetical protein
MNPRTTGLLALAAAILGGFIYFYEIEGETARQAARDDEQRIHPGLNGEDVDAIELTTTGGTDARFERRDGRWRVVSPVSARGDATALDAIAHALTSLPREGVVDAPGDLDQYGLGANASRVGFSAGGASMGLRIGKSTPVGGHVYVAREGQSPQEVVYVESYRVNPLKHSLDDLRDRRLFGFDVGEVRTLRISWPAARGETEIALARDASGQWQMGVPATGRADQQTVRGLLSDLSFLRATGFVDERTDAIESRLAAAAFTVYWTSNGDHVERRARISGASDQSLLVEGPSGELHTIGVDRMDSFKRTINAYRWKLLAEFEVAQARRLVLEFASEDSSTPLTVEARLIESGWTGSSPRIDPDRASALVRALASLRAEDIFADEMGPNELASLGLSPPRVKIRIEDRAEPGDATQVLAEIAIGRFDEARGLFAQRVSERTDPENDTATQVFILPVSVAAALPISRAAFSENFEARDVLPEEDGEELDFDTLGADPMEGVEIP